MRVFLILVSCASLMHCAVHKADTQSAADLQNLHETDETGATLTTGGGVTTTKLRIKIHRTACNTTATQFASALKRGPVQVFCPAACTTNIGPTKAGWAVYGLGPFRIDSAICRAAFLAGVIDGLRGGSATLVHAGSFPEFIPFGAMLRPTFCFRGMKRKCAFETRRPPTRPPTPATASPTAPPTPLPTATPTEPPSPAPTHTPTEAPTTHSPSPSPSHTPTEPPTPAPTRTPTEPPSPAPTRTPTAVPTTPTPTVLRALTGYIKNGVTGAGIAGAIVRFTAGPNAGRHAKADKSGKYKIILGAGGGLSTVEVSGLSAFEDSTETMAMTASLTRYDVDLSPKLAKGEFRTIFSWGANPRDCDIWMTTPDPKCVVSYRQKLCKTVVHHVGLDKDDTSGYGPETITILKQIPGLYKFYVHHYSGSGKLLTSGGIVKVFHKLSTYPFKVTQKTFKVGVDGRIVSFGTRVKNNKLPPWNSTVSSAGRFWSVFAYNSTSHQFATAPNLPAADWTTPPNYLTTMPTRRPTPNPTKIPTPTPT